MFVSQQEKSDSGNPEALPLRNKIEDKGPSARIGDNIGMEVIMPEGNITLDSIVQYSNTLAALILEFVNSFCNNKQTNIQNSKHQRKWKYNCPN